MLTSKERAELRAKANPLETTLIVGKGGVKEAVVAETDNQLTARELVKGKVLEGAGLLRAILGKNDIAYIDSYIHTSAASGLIGTNVKHIGHNDTDYLDMILKRERGKYQTRLVIIDGVYSQNGDLSKLPEYIAVCKKHDCLLMMDDAHGIGVMGENGRGTAEYYNCLGQVDIITGTFSKSFGCVGGFVAASEKLIQYLRYYADSNVFSAAMTPQVAASSLKALELIQTRPEIRKKLWANVNYLRERLTEEGFDIG